MATTPPPWVNEAPEAPQHYPPPGPRELRGQAVQRLQAGLFGLAAILLVVGLANIITDQARKADAELPDATRSRPAAGAPKVDPLADIGVIPSTSANDRATDEASDAANNN